MVGGEGELRNVYNVCAISTDEKEHIFAATEVEKISAPLYQSEIPQEVLASLGVSLDDDVVQEIAEYEIDVLIGLDHYWRFMQSKIVQSCKPGFVAQQSVFGWIPSGDLGASSHGASGDSRRSLAMLCADVLDKTVQQFWELESIGIMPESKEDDVTQHPDFVEFVENLNRLPDGRYEIAIPFIEGQRERLMNN